MGLWQLAFRTTVGRTAPLQQAETNKRLPIKKNSGLVCQHVCRSDLTPTWFLGLTHSHITISDITPTSSSKTPGRFRLEQRCNFYYPRKPYHMSTSNSISPLFIYPSCCFSVQSFPFVPSLFYHIFLLCSDVSKTESGLKKS